MHFLLKTHGNTPTKKKQNNKRNISKTNDGCTRRNPNTNGCTLRHNVCSAQCLGVHQHFVVKIPQPPTFFDGPTFPNEMKIDLGAERSGEKKL